jgi:hypothetical protein
MGRRPELKSDEFFFWNPLDVDILRCENLSTVKKCFTCSEHQSEAQSAEVKIEQDPEVDSTHF